MAYGLKACNCHPLTQTFAKGNVYVAIGGAGALTEEAQTAEPPLACEYQLILDSRGKFRFWLGTYEVLASSNLVSPY